MFDIQWGKRTAIYAVVFHGDYSSSLADAAISSSEGRVARDAGHSGDSTRFIFRRSDDLWSSGDHLRGAAAWAVSPQCGQVVFKENFPQVKHCCIR